MNKFLVVAIAMTLGGCMATEDMEHDDVASQVSAVEEAPAPPETEEDMRIRQLYVACYNGCGNVFSTCMLLQCHLVAGSNCAASGREGACQCEGDCSYDQWGCQNDCSNLFNHAN